AFRAALLGPACSLSGPAPGSPSPCRGASPARPASPSRSPRVRLGPPPPPARPPRRRGSAGGVLGPAASPLVSAARAGWAPALAVSGEEEAGLTFLGATSGRAGEDPTLVLDIGGGSTEFVIGHPRHEPDFHVSTQAGSVRQTERHITDDPPPPDEVAALAEEV